MRVASIDTEIKRCSTLSFAFFIETSRRALSKIFFIPDMAGLILLLRNVPIIAST